MRSKTILLVALVVTVAFTNGCSRRTDEDAADAVVPAYEPLPARTVRVLCYHGVEQETSNFYFNNTEDFAAQMRMLADEGFQSITCEQLASYLAGERDIPERSVLLTFDDGTISTYETAHPIMSRHGFTATLFIYPTAIGNRGHMNWEQVKELHALGYEIGSHSLTHANLTKIDNGASLVDHRAHVLHELGESKSQIQQAIGEQVIACAYPYGNYDELVMAAVREAGYLLAFSIDRGAADQNSDPWRMPRQMVVNGNTLRTFGRWLEQEPLHLTDVAPPVGRVVDKPTIEIRARLADANLGPTKLVAEAGKNTRLTVDDQTGEIVLSTTLAAGANNIRLQYKGSPPRETSWVLVHRPQGIM